MSASQKILMGTLAATGVVALTWMAVAQRQPQQVVGRRNLAQAPAATTQVQKASYTPHDAAEDAAPGQLTILGKDGKPAGLCPLQHTDVQADITGYVTRVNVKQQFHNTATAPVEAVYTFPLPDDAAVDDMTMTIGKRIIKAEIKPRNEAREIYEAAKENGQAAALLDQERSNIFTQSVANIMPGDNVTITISYVHLLKYEEGVYTFHFPMVVGPRYVGGQEAQGTTGVLPTGPYTTLPAAGQRGGPQAPPALQDGPDPIQNTVTDADKINPPTMPIGVRAGHNISLSVKLNAGMPIAELKSVLHEVNVQNGPGDTRIVALKDQQTIPNQDFILKYRVGGDAIQAGVLTHADSSKGGYFTAIIQPPNAPMRGDITPKEMVFVIDQTGSQGGWPIEKAKETMKYCIQNLNPGDTFQLIGFNTEVYPCFDRPVPATEETVAKALKFLAPIEGNGGTDIQKSIEYVLKIPDDPNRLRIVCYMTDGLVGNDMQIMDTIQKNRGRARMFPFGVGNSVNRFLIDGMATEGKGAAEYVTLQDDGKAAAARFYRRIAKPLLMNITVDWNGLPVADVFPKQIPDLFSAGPIILKGRYTQPVSGNITIHGLLRGQPWSQTVHLDLPATGTDGSQIATLWAREKIEDLQHQDWMGAQSGKPIPDIAQQITATALEYRLMSQYTSFVAVEQRVINQGGRNVRIDVPVESPKGAFGEKEELADNAALGLSFRGGRMGRQSSYAGKPALLSSLSRAAAAPSGSLGSVKAQLPVELKEQIVGAGHSKSKDAKKDAEARNKAPEDAAKATKLDSLLVGLADRVKKEGKDGNLSLPNKLEVQKNRVEVQISLDKLPKDGLAKLKALGLINETMLTPDRLLLGWVPIANLEKIAALGFVTRLSPPLYTK